jgi:hypothetical protein
MTDVALARLRRRADDHAVIDQDDGAPEPLTVGRHHYARRVRLYR